MLWKWLKSILKLHAPVSIDYVTTEIIIYAIIRATADSSNALFYALCVGNKPKFFNARKGQKNYAILLDLRLAKEIMYSTHLPDTCEW